MKSLVLILLILSSQSTNGQTIQETFPPPEGFQRVSLEQNNFGVWLRKLKLLPESARVLYYDGRPNTAWPSESRVVDLPFLFANDLEQCADMGYRLFCEYSWIRNDASKMNFRLQNGQDISWSEWSSGHRLQYDPARDRHTVKSAQLDSSRHQFENFLKYLFHWSGSVAMKAYLKKVERLDLQPGDLIVQNETGAMGHVSVILDVVENQSQEKLYLIGNGWTPAQSLFIRKPDAGEGEGYWFSLEGYERHLSGYNFGRFHFRRF